MSDQEIKDLKEKALRLEIENEKLNSEMELKVYEVQALRNERTLLLEKVKESVSMFQELLNEVKVNNPQIISQC